MQDEMESMRKNQVWDMVDLPHGRKTIRNKWFWKSNTMQMIPSKGTKLDSWQKATPIEETFSSVVRFAFIRLILPFVTHLDLELY